MKKFIFLTVTVLALVLIFTSASGNVATDSRIGTRAASFTIGNDSSVLTLNQLRGKWVLLTLWSSADAVARLDNMRYSRIARNNDKLVQVAVNFDRSRALFDEVVSADSLDLSSQYYCERQDRKQFDQKWGTAEQFNTYLIDSRGVVVAVNPGDKELQAAIK
jgi:peroxiredoxin